MPRRSARDFREAPIDPAGYVAFSAKPKRKRRIPLGPGFYAEPGETKGHQHDVYTTIPPLYGWKRIHVGTLMKQAVKALAENDRRRRALSAAVAICMNDERLTDLGTLKRAWFYAETGRDEPVGSRTWANLRVMVRQHQSKA